MSNILVLGLGGFFGAILRYSISGLVQQISKPDGFPYGTLAVNVIGCFMIGALSHLVDAKGLIDPQMRLFIMVGLLGAFTTFSTFSLETIDLIQQGSYVPGALNLLGNNLIGIISVVLGQTLAFRFWI